MKIRFEIRFYLIKRLCFKKNMLRGCVVGSERVLLTSVDEVECYRIFFVDKWFLLSWLVEKVGLCALLFRVLFC